MKIVYPKPQREKYSSLRDLLDRSTEEFGETVLYRYFVAGSEIAEMTYQEFHDNVYKLGTALAARGLRTSNIALLSESRPEWMTALFAGICGGGVIVPMDKELVDEQICNFLVRAEVEAVFCSASFAKKLEAMKDRIPTLKYLFDFDGVAEGSDTDFHEDYKELLARGELLLNDGYVEYTNARFDTSKPALLLFTSGTTGTSKGVLLSQDNLTACIHHSVNMVDIHKGDVLFSVLPLHHTYELCCGEFGGIALGATICFNNSLKYFLRNVKIFKPTAMILVPLFVSTIYKKITDEIKKKGKEQLVSRGIKITKALRKVHVDLRSKVFAEVLDALGGNLRTIICGGAPMDPDLETRFDEFGVQLSQGYGITECSPLVCVVPYTTPRFGSVGLPAYGTSVKIVITDEDGTEHDAPVGEIGEICVKSPQVMLGYYKDEEATAATFNSEGYFRTGDYGCVDADGYLFITGRKKNIIILANGKNVYPEEIEEYLEKIEIVKECCVVARPQENSDPLITAVIFPDFELLKDKTDEEISAIVKKEVLAINNKLPSFKQVRNIELRKTEFEKTTTKKIIRYKV